MISANYPIFFFLGALISAAILLGVSIWIRQVATKSEIVPSRPCHSDLLMAFPSIVAFVAACCLPALQFGDNMRLIPGWLCLVLPIIYPPLLLYAWYWYANPLYVAALVFYFRGSLQKATRSGCFAAILATAFQIMMVAYYWNTPRFTNWNPSHHWEPLRIGSWLWVASFWIFVGTCMYANSSRRWSK